MKLKLLCILLPALALCACANNSQQTTQVSHPLAATAILNIPFSTVLEFPDIPLAAPEYDLSKAVAYLHDDEVIVPPYASMNYPMCGGVLWGGSLMFWEEVNKVPHIKFTVVSGHLSWIPIEGAVQHHLRMRIDGGQGESDLADDQLYW